MTHITNKTSTNSIVLEPTQNHIDLSLIRVEKLQSFVAPVQAISQKREVE